MNTLKSKLNTCLASENFSEAGILCDQLLSVEPNNTYLHAVKGWCLYQQGDIESAATIIDQAVQQVPSNLDVVTLAFTYYMHSVNYEQLVRTAYHCMAFHPDDSRSWHRLGTAHFYLGELTSSVIAFRRSLSTRYTAKSDFGLSQPLLCLEQYEEGFACYEKRFEANPSINWIQSEKLPMPQWRGESLKDKQLLVWSEQGLGDTIQFAQLLTLLSSECVLIDVILRPEHAALYGVLSTVKVINNISIVRNKTVQLHRRYDYHSPVMSLLGAMKIRPDTPLLNQPYMLVPISHRKKWALPNLSKKRIGIVWSTSITSVLRKSDPMHTAEKEKKSLQLHQLQRILQQKNAIFFPLQINISDEEKQELSAYDVDYSIEKAENFSDTAGIISAMDIVISIDTAVAHLAGAMGKPTMTLLHYDCDWRWQRNREETPWYSTMTLYRQTTRNNWEHAVSHLNKQLSDYLS
ncbi:glycosyltransferase family 9 protein [Eionea flava]